MTRPLADAPPSRRKPRLRRHHDGPGMVLNRPTPGFYKVKRGGVWRPALVYLSPARDPITGAAMDRAPSLLCVIDGEQESVWDVWTTLHPCDERTYRHLCRAREGVSEDCDLLTSPVRI